MKNDIYCEVRRIWTVNIILYKFWSIIHSCHCWVVDESQKINFKLDELVFTRARCHWSLNVFLILNFHASYFSWFFLQFLYYKIRLYVSVMYDEVRIKFYNSNKKSISIQYELLYHVVLWQIQPSGHSLVYSIRTIQYTPYIVHMFATQISRLYFSIEIIFKKRNK